MTNRTKYRCLTKNVVQAYRAKTGKQPKIKEVKIKRSKREQDRIRLQQRRNDILNHYGNRCTCCGENNRKFLSIDHVNNDGNRFRKNNRFLTGTNFYSWIIKHNYPSDLQILCYNCNCGKARNNGICPHKEEFQMKVAS